MAAEPTSEYTPNPRYTKQDWDEVSDNPEWTEEDFAHARPLLEVFPALAGKALVSLRLDRDVLERFKADGPGWQTRINDALRKVIQG